jgi:hypothetical protein
MERLSFFEQLDYRSAHSIEAILWVRHEIMPEPDLLCQRSTFFSSHFAHPFTSSDCLQPNTSVMA